MNIPKEHYHFTSHRPNRMIPGFNLNESQHSSCHGLAQYPEVLECEKTALFAPPSKFQCQESVSIITLDAFLTKAKKALFKGVLNNNSTLVEFPRWQIEPSCWLSVTGNVCRMSKGAGALASFAFDVAIAFYR
ncbi:hypothetical protein CDAR_265001 [Caerostris darwini]|uniref:Uncharacterized protein n=1 Tax=Caerostris darwini TaxID=1538125 RepID=A0AAV4W5C8_9ARAC|nr:hypothetical protein CDAR_265001 [Caerostris darwini]